MARPTGFEPVASAFGGKRTPRPVMVPARRAVGDFWFSSIELTAWSRVSAASAAAPLRLPLKARQSSRSFSSDFLRHFCRRAFSLSRQNTLRRRPKLRPNGRTSSTPRAQWPSRPAIVSSENPSIPRDTGKRVPKDMRRHAFEARFCAHPIQYPDHTNEMAIAPIGWECEGRTLPFRHGFDTRYCSVSESPDLSTALCVGEPDAMVSAADPADAQTQNFHSAKPRQKHHSDRCKAGWVLSFGREAPHDLSQMLKFIVAQPPLTAFDGKLSNADRRVPPTMFRRAAWPRSPRSVPTVRLATPAPPVARPPRPPSGLARTCPRRCRPAFPRCRGR